MMTYPDVMMIVFRQREKELIREAAERRRAQRAKRRRRS
jgi:hypothetical protein